MAGLVLLMAAPAAAAQQAADTAASPAPAERGEAAAHVGPLQYSATLQVLAEADHLDVRQDSPFNPDKRIASLARGELFTEFRPDFTADYRRISLAVSPRLTVGRRLSTDGLPSDELQVDDVYVNRWRAKMQLTKALGVSYGRDVLQWGNGVFRSLSNPFFADNGRLNPIRELDGQEFATATYTPSLSYAVSFISNTRGGRASPSSSVFHLTNALKVDYVGKAVNVTLIASKQATAPGRFGAAYTYTASESLLLYGELAASRGTNVLYPEAAAGAIGWNLAPLDADARRVFVAHLAGASYTFPDGLVLTAEYTHNGEGYGSAQAGGLVALSQSASQLVAQGGPDVPAAAQLLGRALDTGLRLERRNYLFAQLLRTEYRRRADVSLSYARNLDDGGGLFSGYITYSVVSRCQLFAVGTRATGASDAEFSQLQRSALSVGVRLFY